MIKKVLDIVDGNFIKVDILNGVRQIQYISYEKNTECFAVYENEKLVGVITKKELVIAHPNRIIADVMSNKYICVDSCSHLWKLKEIFHLNEDVNIIFVEDGNEILGYITRTTLKTELGKHIDLLTGLYKSDYMFYNAYKLIRSGQNTTIIFIDLDKFGYINKKYGHINGDAVLKIISDMLKENLGPDSFLCRYAGDEFAIVTPYSIDDSKLLAEKIVGVINSYKFPNDIAVTASIGITGYGVHKNEVENISGLINKLVNIASLASTKAKRNDNSIMIGDVDIIA